MSKIKSPQEKKELSYEHDRRNTYGENSKSSRKNIRLGKQLSHQSERRAVKQVLAQTEPAQAERIQNEVKVEMKKRKLNSFKKSPDTPLGKVVADKFARLTTNKPQAFNPLVP